MKLQENQRYWLAGILEGEAYFHVGKGKVSTGFAIEMTDEDIIQRVCVLTGNTYCKVRMREDHHKQAYKTNLRGKRAVEIMKEILPLMSSRRSEKIKDCIESYESKYREKDQMINDIKERHRNGEGVKEIGKLYNLSHWRIYQIVR